MGAVILDLSPCGFAIKLQQLGLAKTMAHRRALQRVVVTGLGLVTPLGNGVKRSWANLLAGRSGVVPLGSAFDELPATIGACVPLGTGDGELDLSKYASRAQSVNFIAYALEAAQEALRDARWKPQTEEEQCATGVAIGSGVGNIKDIVDAAALMAQPRGFRKISPYFVPRILVNLAAGHVSIEHGLKGPNHACSTACATGAHAIGDAFRMIERGDADVMVCGGTESSMDRLSVAGFAKAQARASPAPLIFTLRTRSGSDCCDRCDTLAPHSPR